MTNATDNYREAMIKAQADGWTESNSDQFAGRGSNGQVRRWVRGDANQVATHTCTEVASFYA